MRTEVCALSILGRLGSSNQRFWDVPKADTHTFRWILRDEDERSFTKYDDEQESSGEDKQVELLWGIERRAVEDENTQRDVNTRLTTWLQQGSGLFHISGKPGSGKSTLMKYLVQHPKVTRSLEEWAQPKRLALGKFFFWKSDHGQNSLDALIRGLLYSVIHYDAQLVHSAFPRCSKDSFEQLSLQSRLDVTKEEIFEAFNNLVKNSAVSKRFNFCIFIDGLDELDEGKDATYAQIAKLLQQWTETAKGFVKICFSSRPFPVFEDMPVDDRIQLQDLTRYDIISFIHHTLWSDHAFRSEMASNPYDCQRLIRAIAFGSDGVFLWVSLVVKSVQRGLSNADSVTVLLQRVSRTPRQLESLFESLFESIEDCHAPMSLLLLAITMTFNLGPENPIRIFPPVCRQFFRARETSPTGNIYSVFQPNNPPETFDWTTEEARRTKSQLAFRCKGLLEIPGEPCGKTADGWITSRVAFTHRSIPEFLEGWISERMSAQGLSLEHVHNAMCWMLWGGIRFENSTTDPKHLSVDTQGCMRGFVRLMAYTTIFKLRSVIPLGLNLSTAFQLLDLSEDALLPVVTLSAQHGKGNVGSLEGPTWNTVDLEDSLYCPFSPSPLVVAAELSCDAYLRWRLPRIRRAHAPCGDNLQHYLEAAFEPIAEFGPPATGWSEHSSWLEVVYILIKAAGANVNGTLLRCCRMPSHGFDKAGALPSIFDAFWITALFNPSYSIGGFQDEYFHMVEFLLELGATPRSALCIGAARDWFRVSSLQSESPDGIQLGNTEQSLGTGFVMIRDEFNDERLRMICGQNDGIITLEKWVKHAKPANMMTILQLVERNSRAEAKLVDLRELPPTERLRVAELERHGVHRDGKLIWLQDRQWPSAWQDLG